MVLSVGLEGNQLAPREGLVYAKAGHDQGDRNVFGRLQAVAKGDLPWPGFHSLEPNLDDLALRLVHGKRHDRDKAVSGGYVPGGDADPLPIRSPAAEAQPAHGRLAADEVKLKGVVRRHDGRPALDGLTQPLA